MAISDSIAAADAAAKAALNFPLDTLQAEGVALLGGLSLIAIILAGYKTMLSQNPNVRGLMSHVVITLMAIFLLVWVVGSGFGLIFVEGVDGSIAAAADKIFAGASDVDTSVMAGEAWVKVYSSVSDAISRMYENAWGFEVLTITAKNLGAILGLLFSMILIILNMVAFFGLQMLSVMLLKLALLIAPIFLPWALFAHTSFLAASWLRFFLAASLIKLLGAGLLLMSLRMIEGIAGLIAVDADPVTSFFAAISISGVMVTILYIVAKIPQISKELVSAGIARGGLN